MHIAIWFYTRTKQIHINGYTGLSPYIPCDFIQLHVLKTKEIQYQETKTKQGSKSTINTFLYQRRCWWWVAIKNQRKTQVTIHSSRPENNIQSLINQIIHSLKLLCFIFFGLNPP
jgi:hypothetical protein